MGIQGRSENAAPHECHPKGGTLRRTLLILLAIGLVACSAPPATMLLSGMPEEVEYTVPGASKDGPALLARFKHIQDLALDRNGNVYVVDEKVIRKLAADGTVSTFAGHNPDSEAKAVYSLPFDSGTEIAMIDQSLYFTNQGCLLRYDLNQAARSPQFEVIVGKCNSPEDAKEPMAVFGFNQPRTVDDRLSLFRT